MTLAVRPKINATKSSMFYSRNTETQSKQEVYSIMNFNEADEDTQDLGLPNIKKRSSELLKRQIEHSCLGMGEVVNIKMGVGNGSSIKILEDLWLPCETDPYVHTRSEAFEGQFFDGCKGSYWYSDAGIFQVHSRERKPRTGRRNRGAQSIHETAADQQSADTLINSNVPSTANLYAALRSPQQSTRTEVLEVNLETPIHLSTILEDMEFTAAGIEVSEIAGSHIALISDSILNVEDDPEDDLFFPEDMPTHVRSLHTDQEATTSQINQIKESLIASRLTTHQEIQKQIVPIVAGQTTIEASQARLEAKQVQMSDQLTEDSERRRDEKIVGISGSSKAITRFQSRQGEESKKSERRVKELVMTITTQQTLQVTTADEDQEQLRQMEENFKKSMKTVNTDIAVISQNFYEDDPSNRPTKGVVTKEVSRADDECWKNEDKANTKNQKIRRRPEVCLQIHKEYLSYIEGSSLSILKQGFLQIQFKRWLQTEVGTEIRFDSYRKIEKLALIKSKLETLTLEHQLKELFCEKGAFVVDQQKMIESLSAQFNNSMLQAVKGEINGFDDSYPSSGMTVYNTTHYFNEASQQG
ncbi:hypothetical protein AgCh_035782 [Apium graveolens]